MNFLKSLKPFQGASRSYGIEPGWGGGGQDLGRCFEKSLGFRVFWAIENLRYEVQGFGPIVVYGLRLRAYVLGLRVGLGSLRV